MVYERQDDRYSLTVTMEEQLAEKLEAVAEAEPEMDQSRLCREGIRLALEKYE